MARLKIKTPNSKDLKKKEELLGILSSNGIYVTRITTNDCFVILTQDDGELDKLFNNTTDKELQEKNFTPIVPPPPT